MKHTLLAGLVAGAALAAASSASAASQTFTFSQAGYAEGATISGWFIGDDADHDGWIMPFETQNFSLSFSGNSIVGAFTHSMANGGAGGVTYQLGNPTIEKEPYGGFITVGGLGDNDSFDTIRYSMWQWEAEWLPGAVADLHRRVITYTDEPFLVTAVPEPGIATMLTAGLAGIGFMIRRQQRRHGA